MLPFSKIGWSIEKEELAHREDPMEIGTIIDRVHQEITGMDITVLIEVEDRKIVTLTKLREIDLNMLQELLQEQLQEASHEVKEVT